MKSVVIIYIMDTETVPIGSLKYKIYVDEFWKHFGFIAYRAVFQDRYLYYIDPAKPPIVIETSAIFYNEDGEEIANGNIWFHNHGITLRKNGERHINKLLTKFN
jgi:hypothetical protein